jgi:hypothetical protein
MTKLKFKSMVWKNGYSFRQKFTYEEAQERIEQKTGELQKKYWY